MPDSQPGRANAMRAVEQLREGSAIIERLVGERGLRIVGARYSLETGLVEFFED